MTGPVRPLVMIAFALVGGLAGLAAQSLDGAGQAPAEPPDYARDVLPILESNCLRCHNAAKQEGGFVMDSFDDLLRGGDSGERPIVPGQGAGSPMIRQLQGRAKPKMPPKQDLPSDEIAVLSAWIDAGAKYSPPRPVALEDRIPDIAPSVALRPQVTSLAFHPDGTELAVAGYREVRRLSVPSLAPRPAMTGLADLVRAVAWSPDGTLLAAGGGTPGLAGEVVIFDRATGSAVQSLAGHRDYVYHLAFNHDGTRLASCGYDKLVRIWDVATGRPISVLREHTEAVFAVAFSPDGRWVASAAADRSVKLWAVEDGARLHTMTEATDAVTTLAFDPRGSELTAGGVDKSIRTWRIEEKAGPRQIRMTLAHSSPILRLAYSPDGRRLATSGADRRVRIWDTESGGVLLDLEPQPDWAQAVAWSGDGAWLAVGRYDGTVGVYDPATGESRFELFTDPPAEPRSLARQ